MSDKSNRVERVKKMLSAAHQILADKAKGALPCAEDAEILAEGFVWIWAEFLKDQEDNRTKSTQIHEHGPDCNHEDEGLERTRGWGLGYHNETPSIVQFEIWWHPNERESVRRQLKEDTGAAYVWFQDEVGTDKDHSHILRAHEQNQASRQKTPRCQCHLLGRKHCPVHRKQRPLNN